MTALIVIPARYASTRYPAKPLLRETGKFLIQHVVEQARKVRAATQVVVATDDERIAEAVRSFGGTAVMTSGEHQSGTDRIAEVISKAEFAGAEIVVNVQGDEPEIEPELVTELILAIKNRPGVPMATAATPFSSMGDVANPNIVKVVTDEAGFALYFSRATIPFNRDGTSVGAGTYLKHLGLYAYTREALLRLSRTAPCGLEQLEKLEQLRALYLGMKIHVTTTSTAPHGIDTPADYAAFLTRYNQGQKTALTTNHGN